MREDSIDKFVAGNGDLYRRLVEQVPMVTYVRQLGEPNRVVYVSPQIETFLGYRAVDLIGGSERWSNIVHPEDRGRVLEEVTRAGEAGEPLSTEYRTLTKNGRCVWVRDEATVSQDEEGCPRFWHGIITDAVARKQAEEALRTEASRLLTLVKNLQASVLLEDESRHVIHVNQQFCRMFEVPVLPPQVLIGEDCSNSTEEAKHLFSDPEEFSRRIGEILAKRRDVMGEELSLADGRTFERDYGPIFVDENQRGHLWQYRDITERKRAEARVRETKAKYRTLVEQAPAIIYIEDGETGATLYDSPRSRRYSDTLGISARKTLSTGRRYCIPTTANGCGPRKSGLRRSAGSVWNTAASLKTVGSSGSGTRARS